MEPTSRRQFLKRSSAVAAAAGVAAAVPVSAAKVLSASDKAHLAGREPELPDDPGVDVPVVAHVRDARKGLVSLYTGEREVKMALRKTLFKYKLHQDRELFDRAYGYIREYY